MDEKEARLQVDACVTEEAITPNPGGGRWLLGTQGCWWGQTRLDSSSERDKPQVTEWGDAATSWYQEQQVCVRVGGEEEGFIKLALYRELSSVQFMAQSCPTLCDPMDCSTPDFPVHHQLPELAQIHVHRVSDAIQPSHPLSSPSLPAFNLSQHQGFSSESVLHIRWPKYWSFSFSISPSNEYSGLISFRMYRKIILNTREDFPKPGVW